jgi:lysophospholipase L1-like esterase
VAAHATLAVDLEPPPEDVTPQVEPPVLGVDIGLYDPGGAALASFHRALRRAEAGEGQARIVVYGASHVAADFFTNVIRERLQARFGNAGHGFILPARPWRHYRHLGVDVESSRRWQTFRVTAGTRSVERLGLYGVAMESSSSNDWGRIDTGSQTASRFEIYYWRQPGGGSFDLYLDGRRVRRVSTDGEAGPGYALVTAQDARHVLELRVRGNGPVRVFGVAMEREVPGVVVDTLGINGARASSHLYWDEELHRAHLRRRDPSLVVLAYGTNESGDDDQPIEDYEAILRSVVARLKGTVPNASCLLVGPSDRPLRQPDGTIVDRPRTHAIIDVQRRVSRDFGCAFFDLVAFGGGPLHMLEWAASEPPFAQQDLVHYTARGYQRLGEVLLNAMMARFEEIAPAFDAPVANARE